MNALSALLIHGFTAGPRNMETLRACLEEAGISCKVLTLAGHGTHPADMAGTGWERWRANVADGFEEQLRAGNRVAVVGHSMGGLLALELAAHRPDAVAAVVALAPAVCVRDPLDALAPLLARAYRRWPTPKKSYSSVELAARSENYPWFDTAAYLTFRSARRPILAALSRITAPLLVVQSRADAVIPPRAAELVHAGVASPHKEIAWFERSGHEMLQDCEAPAVCARILDFLVNLGACRRR